MTNSGVHRWNLGTGRGDFVLEVIDIFAQVSGRDIPLEISVCRAGNVSTSFSGPVWNKLRWLLGDLLAEVYFGDGSRVFYCFLPISVT